MTTLTLKMVRSELAQLDMRISFDRDSGEYRIAHRGLTKRREERSAYYTTDLGDALATALHMVHARLLPISHELSDASAMPDRDAAAAWLNAYARSNADDPLTF